MTIKKAQAVAMLVALGFAKAASWDDAKLKERLGQVPQKVTEEDVPEGHEALYKQLATKPTDEAIEFADGAAPEKKKSAPEAKEKSSKSATPAKEAKTPAKSEKTEKKTKSATPAKKKIEFKKDSYGCREGSISAKVNAVVTGEWKSEQEIADAAGVSVDQARGRLYYGAIEGQDVFEREKLIRYRLKPAKKAKK